MVSIRSLGAALLIAGSGAVVRAADTNADTQAFIAHQAATQTFEADLRQTFHWTIPPHHVESIGHISYRAPGWLAIVLTNPVPELVLVRDGVLYSRRGNKPPAKYKSDVRNGKPTQNVQFLLGFFQNGCTNFAGLFNVHTTYRGDSHLGTLLPKHAAQMFPLRSVDNVIEWPSMDVRSMRIGLIFGSYISYDFSNPRRNQPLDARVFEVPQP